MSVKSFFAGVSAALSLMIMMQSNTRPNLPVIYFEVPVVDMNRATKFYEAVFGYDFEMAKIDGNEMALFPADPSASGASGALAKGESYKPSLNGARLYFYTADIVDTMKRAKAAGGKELYPITDVGEFGKVAEFRDSEGNRIALSQPPKAE